VTRPRQLVLVAGTGTEVGKTWVGAALLGHWRTLGLRVAARKTAQSFEEGSGPTDAEVLAAASGETPARVCPEHRWYPVAMAPPMAAEVLGRPTFVVADLVAELDWEHGTDVGLLEGAGGVRSPQADDGDLCDVAAAVGPDAVVVVADAGLGTIASVRHAVNALADVAGADATAIDVVLNRFDPESELHRRNLDWLRRRDGLRVSAVDGTALATLARRLAPLGTAG
jgi:dethiobiotin synthetase